MSNSTHRIFNWILSNKADASLLDGWDMAALAKLPEKEQQYLIQFAREYTGSCSKKDLLIMDQDQLREQQAYRKYRQDTQTALEVSLEPALWEAIPASDTGNPESQAIAMQEFQLKLERKEKRATTLYSKFSKL